MSGCLRPGWGGDTSTVGALDEHLKILKMDQNVTIYVRHLEKGRQNLYKSQQFDPEGKYTGLDWT